MESRKKKLLLAFFTIISVLLIAESFFLAANYIILSKYTALTSNMISEYSVIDQTSSLIDSFNRRVKFPADQAEINHFRELHQGTKDLLSNLKSFITDYSSKIAFNGLENNVNDIIFDLEIGVKNLERGDYLEAVERYNSAKRKNEFVRENANNLIFRELAYAKGLQVEIENVRSISFAIAIIFLLLSTAGCIWYAIVFSNDLANPLVSLTRLAGLIEAGDLNTTVDKALMAGNDEIASLARSFNTMVLSLRSNIQRLQEYNREIQISESRLKSEKNKLQQYLDTAGVAVLVLATNNKVLLINKKGCEILGAKAADIIGQDIVEGFVGKKDRSKTSNQLAMLLGGNEIAPTFENIMVSKDGTEKNIVWRFSLLKKGRGEVEGILAAGADVTELVKAKITINQLRELDKFKNDVLNIATHELKTPLVSVVGLSEVMSKKPENISPEYLNYINIIHQEGVKLTTLIRTMLSASRNEISKEVINKTKFNLADLVLSLSTSLNMLAKRTNSRVDFEVDPKEVMIESDKTKISQVIYNFVDNAVKYGLKNQAIKVRLFKLDERTVRIEVKNDGQGIPKPMQSKIFMKFSQLNPTLSRSEEGLGLGLYICKQNIENLGGKIGVESEVNQGSTFFFTLPINI